MFDDVVRNDFVKGKDAGTLASVLAAPYLRAVGGVDEFGADDDVAVQESDTSGQHNLNIKFFPDDLRLAPLVAHDGIERHHFQPGYQRESVDETFRDSICQVV